ncbi:MAG TPA: glycerophosphodiester phosphodiesterase family protein [bacterium]|nr:glycerophosphodiester phosphodiesterase family protein [bacterium]
MNADERRLRRKPPQYLICVHLRSSAAKKTIRPITLTALTLLSALLLSLPARAFYLVGHRGERYIEDENTLEAMDLALERGANAIETDLRLTRDNVIVIMHDPTVTRTTNGHGRLRFLSLSEFQALKTSRGHTPPTLEQVLQRFSGREITLFLEIKEPKDAMLQPLIALLEKYRGRASIIVFAINAPFLASVKSAAPWVKAFYAPINPLTALSTAQKYRLDGLLLADFFTTKRMVPKAHSLNRPVVTSMLQRRWEVARVLCLGVDGVLVNDPRITPNQ